MAFVGGIHRLPVNSTHKRPVTWKMFPFDNVIMDTRNFTSIIQGWFPGIGALIQSPHRQWRDAEDYR